MRTLYQIRAELDRALRRHAQAYLYGTPAERAQCQLVVERLAAEESTATRQWSAHAREPQVVLPR
jgi:hypothetical protein